MNTDNEKVLTKDDCHLQKQIDTIKILSDEREMSLNAGGKKLFIVNFT